MRKLAVAIVAAACIAAPAVADAVDVLKANTLVLTAPGGGTTIVLVGEDGRMEQVNAAGMWAAGIWAISGRGFCWTARGEAEVCIPLPPDKAVGDNWDVTGPTGRVAWSAEIRAGRADVRAGGESGAAGAAATQDTE